MKIKGKFDKEYSTQWVAEKEYLEAHGIKYDFVKTIDGISTFKYRKNFELFKTLSMFYENVYSK